MSIGAPSKGRPMRLDDTSLRSIFIELANATQLGYFVITRNGAPAKSGLNHVLDIGYRDGPIGHIKRSGAPVGTNFICLMMIPNSKFSQGHMSTFSSTVWVICHTQSSKIIDK